MSIPEDLQYVTQLCRDSRPRPNLYRILELKKDAKAQDIEAAYRRLALKYHPDKNNNCPTSADKFKDINRAHRLLSDAYMRRMYDLYGYYGLEKAHLFKERDARPREKKLSTLACCVFSVFLTILTCCQCVHWMFSQCCSRCAVDEEEESDPAWAIAIRPVSPVQLDKPNLQWWL